MTPFSFQLHQPSPEVVAALAPRVGQESHSPSLHKSDLFRKVKLESGKMDHYYKIPYFGLTQELS